MILRQRPKKNQMQSSDPASSHKQAYHSAWQQGRQKASKKIGDE
jgi:hypothetical protein